MTVVVYVLAGIGAITILAAVALIGATCRETALCRHIDAQAPPEPAEWVLEPPVQWDRAKDEALTEWEREIRTDGLLEDAIAQELGT